MAEQRLIDANNLGVHKASMVSEQRMFAYGWNSALQAVKETSPTINPEALPVVQQLRDELSKERKICDDLQADLVKTALEREAACKELLECALLLDAECICCAHLKERTVCPMCKEGSQWEWRGPQEKE